MGKTRSLARALAGPIGPSHHVEYFSLFFWKRQRENEKKMNLGNEERPNVQCTMYMHVDRLTLASKILKKVMVIYSKKIHFCDFF